jgi:hypothetical protein
VGQQIIEDYFALGLAAEPVEQHAASHRRFGARIIA